MKIGIVTFYRVANYGAMLQAYALWKYLESCGHEVVFVQYPRTAPARLSLLRCFVSWRLEGVRKKLKQYVRFPMTRFASIYPQTVRCETWEDLKCVGSTCDAFIVGSDQMWNPIWCSGEHLPFVMLDFVEEGKKRISYAVSFSVKEWRADQNAKLAASLIKKFNTISVREESGIKIVRQLAERDAQCVLDPTMLHDAAFYCKFITSGRTVKPYVFWYSLDEWADSENELAALESVCKELNIQEIQSDLCEPVGPLSIVCRMMGVTAKVPVEKWLEGIAKAEFVVTNSFHGTVFSILFHRPFISLLLRGSMSGMNERLLSLLGKVGLENRAVYPEDTDKLKALTHGPIEWGSVDASLNDLREHAKSFISKGL